MFHFPALPPHWLYIHQLVTRHHSCRVSPFGHPRIHARLAAPRGISQPPTSFIGSRCQGIHHAPLNTYKHKNQETKIAKQTRQKPRLLDARNHYSQNKHHTPPPRWSDNTPTPHRGENRPVASGPNSVPSPKGRPPETQSSWQLMIKDVVVCKTLCTTEHPLQAPGEKYPNHHDPALFAGTGENGAP